MAPRRGGGGGGSVRVECSAWAFSDPLPITLISFFAFFVVFYLILSVFLPRKKKQMALNGGQPLRSNGRWKTLGWAIWLAIIALILKITSIAMMECGSSFEAYMPVSTTQLWLTYIALLFLWGAILVPVCKDLHKVSGSLMPKLVAVVHSAFIGWLGFLMVAWLSVTTAARHLDLDDYYYSDTQVELAKASNGLYVTVTVFGLIGMLMTAASMIMALSRSGQLATGSLKSWVYTLSFASVLHSVIELAIFVRLTYGITALNMTNDLFKEYRDLQLAQVFLQHFFFGLMFLSAVFVLKNPTVISETSPPTDVTYSSAPNPADQQQQPQPPMAYNTAPTHGYQGANYQAYPPQPQVPAYHQQ